MNKCNYVLAWRVENLGSKKKPLMTRVGEFLEIHIPVTGPHEDWSPVIGEPIPRDLIVHTDNMRVDEAYLFAAQPDHEVLDILNFLKSMEETFETEKNPRHRLADFCIKIIDSTLGPPK